MRFVPLIIFCCLFWQTAIAKTVLTDQIGLVPSDLQLGNKDALLLSSEQGEVLLQWRADQLMIPASLMKLVTADLALEKWGKDHRFKTEFWLDQDDSVLWIRGLGDPFLISEEIDLIVEQLKQRGLGEVLQIKVDDSLFFKGDMPIPGRGNSNDPYNAPLSALAANFNTTFLVKKNGGFFSAEPQTPLTPTAIKLAKKQNLKSGKKNRINLVTQQLAQRHFVELLIRKMQWSPKVYIEATSEFSNLPKSAKLLYSHSNSHSLSKVLRGALEYSNNFIANQLFVLLAEDQLAPPLDINKAAIVTRAMLDKRYQWQDFEIVEGAGLSRNNQLSAKQIDQVLVNLEQYRSLLKEYQLTMDKQLKHSGVVARAKSGTLNGVHTFAGYLQVNQQQYRFVFLFNRAMPYRYREKLLSTMANRLLRHQR